MAILDTFRQRTAGLLRPNKFRMKVFFPAFIGNQQELADSCEYWIRTATLPSREVGVVDLPFRGTPFSVAGDFQQPADITVTILNDGDMTLRKAFEAWIEFIASPVAGTRANDLTYFGTAEIAQLDGADAVVKTYQLINLFPVSVGEIALSMDSIDEVETFDVTFRYSTPITSLL